MKQLAILSIAVAAAVAPGAYAQITREGRYWVETVNGTATATPLGRVRLDTVGNVVVQGEGGGQVSYKLKLRVKARDLREAQTLLREFEVRSRNQNGWLR